MGACTTTKDCKIVMELLDGDLETLLHRYASSERVCLILVFLLFFRSLLNHWWLDGWHNSPEGKQLSLHQRLLMAKDVALGINWLHKSVPAIIHRLGPNPFDSIPAHPSSLLMHSPSSLGPHRTAISSWKI